MVDWSIIVPKKLLIVFRNANTYVLKLKWFQTFMKFVAFMLYVIPHTLGHVCEPCKKLDNFHLTNEFFSKHWPHAQVCDKLKF
jgi:hypothetical protein